MSEGKSQGTTKFLVFADLHIDIMHDTIDRIKSVIDAAKSADVDFIISLGDMTYPDSSFYKEEGLDSPFKDDPDDVLYYKDRDKKEVLRLLNECDIPVYYVLGNHDMDRCTKEQALKYLGINKAYYSFNINNRHFIVLDTNYIKAENGQLIDYEHGNYFKHPIENFPYLPKEQLQWLEDDIMSSPYPSIIFSHQPLLDEKTGLRNFDKLQAIFRRVNAEQKRVMLCMNGHTHIDRINKCDDVYFLDINSISTVWVGRDYQHIRYSDEIDRLHPSIKYTAPYKEPIYAIVTASDKQISIKGMESDFIGPSPYALGVPKAIDKSTYTPTISSHVFKT